MAISSYNMMIGGYYIWTILAADKGDKIAIESLNNFSDKLTKEQILTGKAKAKRRAVKYKTKKADSSSATL